MFLLLTANRKYLYITLALIPIAVGALGFFTLLKSPYTGINFESKDGKWYVASVEPGSPASNYPEIVGTEVVAIGDFRLGKYDLIGEFGRISDKDSFEHFWEAKRYFILVPLSMSFAILKYRLMDIDTLFDNTLIYTVTLGLLVLLDMAVITALIKAGVLDFPGSNPFVAISILVWTVIFAYLPVRNFIQGRIKRLLKREVYDANQAALELSRELLSATDVPAAVEKTMDAIKKTLHPKGERVYLHNDTHPHLNPLPDGEETILFPPFQG